MSSIYNTRTAEVLDSMAIAMEMRAPQGMLPVAEQVVSALGEVVPRYGGTSRTLDIAVESGTANCRLRALSVAEATARTLMTSHYVALDKKRHGYNILYSPSSGEPVVVQNTDGERGNAITEAIVGDNMAVYHPVTEHIAAAPGEIYTEIQLPGCETSRANRRIITGLPDEAEYQGATVHAVYLPGSLGLAAIRRAVTLTADPATKAQLTAAFTSPKAIANFVGNLPTPILK